MTNKTKIEWTHEVWNPIAGCSVKSAGCDNCYAMTMAYRLEAMGLDKYQGTTRKSASGRTLWTGKVNFDEKALMKPLSWKKPRRIFVNSMSDLFHENVPDEWIDKIFAVMALCPQHTFQILTKRPERMLEYMTGIDDNNGGRLDGMRSAMIEGTAQKIYADRSGENPEMWLAVHLPLPNVWLVVSVEDQKTADERIPLLFDTLAAVRGISVEPSLGHIDLWEWFPDRELDEIGGLDWVIIGGESGPNARPMHPQWARSLRDQCKAAGVPFFFKQWGEWLPNFEYPAGDISKFYREGDEVCLHPTVVWNDNIKKFERMNGIWTDKDQFVIADDYCQAEQVLTRVGKKFAGHLLDGKVIQQYPGDV